MDRVTVQEVAQRLRISQDAVRQRIRRGSLKHEKDGDGRVYVYLDPTDTRKDTRQQDVHQDHRDAVINASTDVLVDELRDRVRFLEDELRRKDTILMSLVQRVPELEAPTEATRGLQTASDDTAKVGCTPGAAGDLRAPLMVAKVLRVGVSM